MWKQFQQHPLCWLVLQFRWKRLFVWLVFLFVTSATRLPYRWKGTKLQLKFVDFVASPYPAESKRDLSTSQEVHGPTDGHENANEWIFTSYPWNHQKFKLQVEKNIFNSNSTTQIDESWSTKLPPSSYPLKSWSIELICIFTWSTKGPQNLYFKTNLKCDLVFFGCCQGTTLVRETPSARLRFAGSSFLFWKLLNASRLRAKKRNFRSATWCGQPPLD